MAVFVVTWNINKAGPAYALARQRFLKQFETLDSIAESSLDSVRFVVAQWSANDLSEYLRRQLDTNDRLFVTMLRRGEYGGWLDTTLGPWLNARL